MAYSLEQIKGEISRGDGLANANLFRVLLPIIPGIYLNQTGIDVPYPQSINILCKSVTMPGRSLTTVERDIGVVNQKVAYGFVNDDINMTFIGLNDYVVRKYLEDWQFYAMNPDTHEMKYKNEYAKDLTIQQLDKKHRVVYAVKLEKAFPTQLLNIDFSNEQNGLVDINATFSYTRWRRTNIVRDFISTETQNFLEDILIRG